MTKSEDYEQGLPPPMQGQPAWPIGHGRRIWIGGNGVEARRALEKRLAGATRPPIGRLDVAFITPLSADEAVYFSNKLHDRLLDTGELWVVFLLRNLNHDDGQGEDIDTDRLVDRMKSVGFHLVCQFELDEGLQALRFDVRF